MPENPRRDARRKAGYRTQTDLANAIGVHWNTVAKWESTGPYPTWLELYLETKGELIELKSTVSSLDRIVKAME